MVPLSQVTSYCYEAWPSLTHKLGYTVTCSLTQFLVPGALVSGLSDCHTVTLSHSHTLTLSHCHTTLVQYLLLHWYTGTLTYWHIGTLVQYDTGTGSVPPMVTGW